ncbi:MAG: MlaD family protein [Sulfurovum sp.]
MYSRVNYTVVGLFVIIFGSATVWFTFWIGKYSLNEEFNIYRLEMKESIAGLSKDSNVKLHGVNIGRVSDIHINPYNIEIIEVFLKIKKGIPIKEDMIASTQMLGVTGLLSIEIDGGTNEAKDLVSVNGKYPLIQSKLSLLSKFTNKAEDMRVKLDRVLTQIDKLLSDKNIQLTQDILISLNSVIKKYDRVADRMILSLDDFNNSMQMITTKFTKATEDFKLMQEDFRDMKEVSIPTINNMHKTSKNFNRMTLRFGKSLRRGDYNFKKIFEPMLVDISILSNQINDLSRDLGQNPSSIIFKSRKRRKGPGE